jgi:hypothetical protein
LKINAGGIYEFDYLSGRFGRRDHRGVEFFRTALDLSGGNKIPQRFIIVVLKPIVQAVSQRHDFVAPLERLGALDLITSWQIA